MLRARERAKSCKQLRNSAPVMLMTARASSDAPAITFKSGNFNIVVIYCIIFLLRSQAKSWAAVHFKLGARLLQAPVHGSVACMPVVPVDGDGEQNDYPPQK